MKRLIIGVAVLLLSVLPAACGQGRADAPAGPSVTVSWDQVLTVSGSFTGTLTPAQRPSGIIAFKEVHDGHVQTLAHSRFHSLSSRGAVRLDVGRNTIDAAWTLPGGTGKDRVHVVLLRRSHEYGGVSGGLTIGPPEMGGEWVIWVHERFLGAAPLNDNLPMGDLDELVSSSLEYPDRVVYCLTLEVLEP